MITDEFTSEEDSIEEHDGTEDEKNPKSSGALEEEMISDVPSYVLEKRSFY